MMTVDEALELALEADMDSYEDDICTIDADTREVTVPQCYEELGVESDEDSSRIYFACPRYTSAGLDLATMNIYINYMNANGGTGRYIVDDVTSDETNITFSWLIGRTAVAYKGTVAYLVCAKESEDGVITAEWNSKIAYGNVSEGLEVEIDVDDETYDAIEQLLTLAQSVSDAADDKVQAAINAAQEALEETLAELGTLVADVTQEEDGVLLITLNDGTTKTVEVGSNETTVTDIEEADGGILVTMSDGTTKTIEVDTTSDVKVTSISAADTGIVITYSDGTTETIEIGAVSDIVESSGSLTIYYADGTTKTVSVGTTDVTVTEVNKSENGITITYSDGTEVEIEISSGSSSSSTSGVATITRITDASLQCVYGNSVEISYTFSATDSAGDAVGDGTATWYVNSVAKATSTASQGDNTFDIGSYLSVGSNSIRLSISVDTGGESNTVVTKTWTVNAVNMYAVWDYDDTTINTGDTFTLYWTPYGSNIEKTSHFIIDGEEAATSTTTKSGTQQSLTLDSLSHGSHTAELYLTATVNDTEIQSESIIHDMIFVEDGETDPVIAVSLDTYTMTQYNTLQIPIVIYVPGSSTADATLAVDGETVAEWTDIDRTVHYWNYTPSTAGEKTLTITCGTTTKTLTITVEELDIDNEEVSGYAFRLKAADIATNDALQDWESEGVTATFSDNFDWNNGGLQTEEDDDGNIRQYICVKAGTTMTIGYELFGGTDPKSTGKSFKIIFKIVNSRDYDATFLDCTYNDIGLTLQANAGTITSLQNTLETQYAEDTYTEFEFDIRKYSVQPYIQTYIDGVLSGNVLYASDDDFNQTTAQDIVIGSEDCDVYIYMVKAYETYLTMDNHIENFIADAPNATEMVERYNRNDVADDNGDISYSKLAAQCPELRIHLWDIPRMSEGKKDYVSGCSYKQIYHSDDSDYTEHQISADGVTIAIQGTSSVDYRAAGANTDGDFSTCTSFTDGNGNDLMDTGYAMTDDSIPVSYFNTKVNIASCENVNNMCLAEWYNRYQPYETLYRESNEQARDTMELHMGVQFISDQSGELFDYDGDYHMYAVCNMGNSKKNIEVFHDITNLEECCVEVLDNNSDYCKMVDEIDLENLQSEDFFEFRYSADYADSDTYTSDELTAAKSAQEEAFLEFVQWMASCNPGAATDEALSESVTYDSYTFAGSGRGEDVLAGLTIDEYAGTYTTDSYEYRMAKMLSECEDHLIMDSLVYHYVFVEEHAMVDNVCKNTFWGTEDLQHWQLTKNYDNDTADGINNTGELVIPYGCEGMDTLDDGDVFNGKDAVWWVFVNGLYDARQLMWQDRENAGAWDHEAYLEFVQEYQDLVPERVYNQDYWYKYLRLYEESSDSTYFDMLEGGKKTHQRESFVENNMYYMASQYMGTACTSSSITLRGYTPSSWSGVEPESKVEVALYAKGYIVVQVGSIYKQQKAEKGTYYTIEFSDSGDMNDTVINIHGANRVQAVGDISCLYVGRSDFSAATKLRSLTIGSTEEGYSNSNLTSVSFGSNTMLEELYIQNCPNIETTLDLSGCQALTTLDIRGSGFTGVTFAVGGLISTAYLCAVKSLNMQSLYNLYDDGFSLESYDSLTGLRFEDVPNVDSLTFVQTATALTRIRMTGIDWTLDTTDLLNELLELAGYDESNINITQSVLAGTVTISGDIRQSELDEYAEAWEDLEVYYESGNLINTYLIAFYNDDGTLLYSYYADQGSYPVDPIEAGYIDTPTKDSTAQYDYTYAGWDTDLTSTVRQALTVTATYTETTRTYTVNFYALSTDSTALETQEVEYGTDVVYSGDTPTRAVTSSGVYSLFAGWDKSTGFVDEDLDVYAVWERDSLPEYGTDLSDMSLAQIFALRESGEFADYVEDKDYFEFALGSDFDFENVESETILEDTFFDGTAHYDTDIQLFSDDAPDFTIAIDFEYISTETTGATLVSLYEEDGAEGFRLQYYGTGTTGYPRIEWGDVYKNCGYGCYRGMVVLRHRAGENDLYVYSFDTSTSTAYSASLSTSTITRTASTESNETLTFGAVKNGEEYSDYGAGWIYWCKIWYADLGETIAEKLAAWPHQTHRMEYAGATATAEYLTKSGDDVTALFVSNNPLSKLRTMNSSNTNAGGWEGSLMNQFLNDRFWEGLPYDLQNMIQSTQVKASAGSTSTSITTSICKIFLPCYNEMGGGSSSEPYVSEGSAISYYTSNQKRAKIVGTIQTDEATLCTGTAEPTTSETHAGLLNDGDLWWNGSYMYAYMTADTRAKHSTIIGTTTEADDGGLWVRSYNWWLRSPNASNSNYFYSVYENGTLYSYYAYATYAIVPSFTI